MKRLFAFAPGLFLAAMTAMPATADESFSYSVSDEVYAEPVSMLGDAPTPGQKDDYCGCDTKGGKGGKGGKSGCGPFDLGDHLFGEVFRLGSRWLDTSSAGPPPTTVFSTPTPTRLTSNRATCIWRRSADGSCGLDFGGRVDVMYGTDGSNTQSFGNNFGRFDFANGFNYGIYGWAIPQVYGEVAYEDWSVKVGHFYTLLGYQVVPATGNFFYSIPYTFNFSEAFTHTGALATYSGYDDVTLYGGWTLGWDTGFDQVRQGNSFLGGASVNVTDDLTATYIVTAGNLGWIGNNAYTHSFVADWNINDCWEYVFQSDLNSIDNSPNAADGGHYETIGINQYLFYTFNDKVRAGARVEWWKADGISVNEMAFGFNIKPRDNVLIRPEIRYNWVPGGVSAIGAASGWSEERDRGFGLHQQRDLRNGRDSDVLTNRLAEFCLQ